MRTRARADVDEVQDRKAAKNTPSERKRSWLSEGIVCSLARHPSRSGAPSSARSIGPRLRHSTKPIDRKRAAQVPDSRFDAIVVSLALFLYTRRRERGRPLIFVSTPTTTNRRRPLFFSATPGRCIRVCLSVCMSLYTRVCEFRRRCRPIELSFSRIVRSRGHRRTS